MSDQDSNLDGHFAYLEDYFRHLKARTPEDLREAEAEGDDAIAQPEEVALSAVALALRAGVTVPSWAAKAFLQALARYESFEVASLGEAFACRDHTHLKAKHSRRLMLVHYRLVQEERRARKMAPKLRGQASPEATVGKMFGLSASTVRDNCRAWRQLCALRRTDPDERLRPPSAGETIYKAMADALGPRRATNGDVQ